MARSKLMLIVVVGIALFGCQRGQESVDHRSPQEIIHALDSSCFVQKYSNYDILPVEWGVDRVYVKFPDGFHFFVTHFDIQDRSALRIVRSAAHIDDFLTRGLDSYTETEKLRLKEAYEILSEFEKHHIISYQKMDHVEKLYTTVPYGDSTGYVVLFRGLTNYDSASLILTHDLLTKPISVNSGWSYAISSKYAKYLTGR